MSGLVDRAPVNFATTNSSVLANLGASKASYIAGPIIQRNGRGSAPVTEHLNLAGIGTVTLQTVVHLQDRSGRWLVEWAPSTIDPALTSSSSLSVTTTWAPRAPILGADGAPLTTQAPMVIIGVEGAYVKDPLSLGSALTTAGASSQAVASALASAKTNPTYFEPVLTVTKERYLQLKATLYPLPGTVFQATTLRTAITPGLEAHLVGSTGPITAQQVHQLGPLYDASSNVGQTGLEQVYESQLAGRPGATITVVDAKGSIRATIAKIAPRPGSAVKTSIDPHIQQAAEAALAGEQKSAVLVAVRASTGQVLASVSNPSSGAFDQALDGTFPPGSTFKTITSTALINDGLSPASPASCPASVNVGGAIFHNAENEAPVTNLAQAFTESCNTAFIQLATSRLKATSLPTAAALYDLGKTPSMGIPAFGGSVPTPSSPTDLAATSIGQGKVLVSPLAMAMVAAAIDTGTVREPRLVAGAPDDTASRHILSAAVVKDLHQMMADVVSTGTAAHQGLPPGTFAKTGTAEYGNGSQLPTDAWLIGFNGDIAFAALVVHGGNGGPTCGPLVATFLNSLGNAK